MTPKSNRAPVGFVQCENTTLNLLKANDFVAKAIRERGRTIGHLLSFAAMCFRYKFFLTL